MKYLPFLDGNYSVAPALQPLKRVENTYDKLVFQVDDSYHRYIENKLNCRKEDISKYYREEKLSAGTAAKVNRFIVQQLLTEHPEHFEWKQENSYYTLSNKLTNERLHWKEDWLQIESERYLSLFDALASQVQEDMAVCQLEDDKDWMAAIHVCSANHWSPAEKAGKSFTSIHSMIPGMEKAMPHHFKMLTSVVNKGPFTRFAWGISTDDRLNHHLAAPAGENVDQWQGRKIENDCSLFVRVERQTVTGLPAANAFLFTIRTYFYAVNELLTEEKSALLKAVESMSAESLSYKGLFGKVEVLREMLFGLKQNTDNTD